MPTDSHAVGPEQAEQPDRSEQAEARQGLIDIEVVLALPEIQYLQHLKVPVGTTARQAVIHALQAGLLPEGVQVDVDPQLAPLGCYAEKVADSHCCQAGDRVEIYRPLKQDPMELRRQRARQSIS